MNAGHNQPQARGAVKAPDMAVEAKVEQVLADLQTHYNNTDSFNGFRKPLKSALRAALARPQEVAGDFVEHSHPEYGSGYFCTPDVFAKIAASRAPVAVGVEPEGDVQLRACDQTTGREYFIKKGPRAQMQAEADAQNEHGHDYFLVPPAPSAGAGGSVVAEPAERWEIVRETVVSDVPDEGKILTHAKPYAPEWPTFDSWETARDFHRLKKLPLGWIIKRIARPLQAQDAAPVDPRFPAAHYQNDLTPSERAMDDVLKQRDYYHDVADDLAAQIASITGEDIGEHSSSNNPWQNAANSVTEYLAAGVQGDAARYRHLREKRQTMLIVGYFGNGCINKTIEDVEAVLDADISAQSTKGV